MPAERSVMAHTDEFLIALAVGFLTLAVQIHKMCFLCRRAELPRRNDDAFNGLSFG
jgi:hypothetical protein